MPMQLQLFATSALEGGGWPAPRLSRFTPGKTPVHILQGALWASGSVWTARKNSPPPGLDLRTVRPLAISYTDYATLPQTSGIYHSEILCLL
jgi:hypothetical protein